MSSPWAQRQPRKSAGFRFQNDVGAARAPSVLARVRYHRRMGRGWTLLCVALAGCGASTETDATPSGTDVSVDLLGTWHTCSSRLTFTSDGSWSFTDDKRGCGATGTWSGSGDHVDLASSAAGCDSAPTAASSVQVVRTKTSLALVYPSGEIAAFAANTSPRTRYRLTGEGGTPSIGGASILSLVGAADAYQSACYWSEDGACGGLLSCNGSVEQWTLSGAALVGKLGCGGECPCAAIFQGEEQEPGHLKGTFQGADCNMTFSGTFDATEQPQP